LPVAEARAEVGYVRAALRTHLSKNHLAGVRLFRDRAEAIEDQNPHSGVDGATREEHRAYIVGAIMLAVGYLEATINEAYTDASEGHLAQLQGASAEAIESWAGLWKLGSIDRASVLEKFQIALIVGRFKPFDRGAEPYQSANLLVKLRNELVHFRPAWASGTDEHGRSAELERRLQRRFPTNPFVAEGNPFFPDKCLSHGAAAWAESASTEFAREFFSRVGVKRSG
jgi:hypothetical protein